MKTYAYYIVIPPARSDLKAQFIGPFRTETERDEEVKRLTLVSNENARKLRGSCRFTRVNHYRANIEASMVAQVVGEKQIAEAA